MIDTTVLVEGNKYRILDKILAACPLYTGYSITAYLSVDISTNKIKTIYPSEIENCIIKTND